MARLLLVVLGPRQKILFDELSQRLVFENRRPVGFLEQVILDFGFCLHGLTTDARAGNPLAMSPALEVEVRVPSLSSLSRHCFLLSEIAAPTGATISRPLVLHPSLDLTPRKANASGRQLLKWNLPLMNPVADGLRRSVNPSGKLVQVQILFRRRTFAG